MIKKIFTRFRIAVLLIKKEINLNGKETNNMKCDCGKI